MSPFTGNLHSGKRLQFAIENGPVEIEKAIDKAIEIVDLPLQNGDFP